MYAIYNIYNDRIKDYFKAINPSLLSQNELPGVAKEFRELVKYIRG